MTNNSRTVLSFRFTLLLVGLSFISCCLVFASASKGTVVKRISGCDYFMVAAPSGYAVLEWYGGHDPDKDDVLIGKFEEYGMHDILDDTADESLRVWTEDYALSRTRALEVLVDQCGE